jgi:hypothetical protein
MENKINAIIVKSEIDPYCRCADVSQLKNNLSFFLGQNWSIICAKEILDTITYTAPIN